MAIDDELDAIRSQHPESQSNLVVALTLKMLSVLPVGTGLVIKLTEVLRAHFSTRIMGERLRLLFDALEQMVRRLDRRMSDVEKKLDNAEFAQAYVSVANVAVFTADENRIRQFGSILGYEAASGDNGGWDEAAALVADLSRLTDADIEVLRMMVQFQGDKIRENPDDAEYGMMLTEFSKVREEAVRKGLTRYELYAHALRLSGFGLAHPLNWNPSAWGPQDMGFAPTPRGKKLMNILQMAEGQR
jgi:hypothetical protein